MFVGTDECPIDFLPEMQFCAAQGMDHRKVSSLRQLSTLNKTWVFSAVPRPGLLIQRPVTSAWRSVTRGRTSTLRSTTATLRATTGAQQQSVIYSCRRQSNFFLGSRTWRGASTMRSEKKRRSTSSRWWEGTRGQEGRCEIIFCDQLDYCS